MLNTNFKLKKYNGKFKTLLMGLSLAPSNISGRNVCPNASPACKASCLFYAGMGQYPSVQAGRIRKTKLFFSDRVAFMDELIKSIKSKKNSANNKGWALGVRLNTLSDIAWETIKVDGKTVFELFPTVKFFDYTKSHVRMKQFLRGEFPKNYHLTFSRSEVNQKHVNEILAMGGNVAVVFDVRKGKPLPTEWNGMPVFDGDKSDFRYKDPKNVIVGLKAKGTLRRHLNSGFVVV